MKGPVEIVPGVHGLGSEMVNWYLVEDEEGVTAVDAGLPGFTDDLETDLRSIGHGPADVDAVVLTHCDADHTGVAPALRDAGARVLIHSDDDARLRKPGPKKGDASTVHLVPYMRRPQFWRLMGHMIRAGGLKPPKIEGAETYADGDVLDVPGHPRVLLTPGHTPGECVLVFEGRALFVGDALCTWNPFTWRRGPQVMPSGLNVDTAETFESLAKIEGIEAQVLLPGHGDPWREGASAAVARAREAGRS